MTTKYPSPLLGYNNNVRHKGKVFHIQTEDSGAKYGHIITHLFMDGGRIVKSVKTSYAEYLGADRMGDIVREMMKQQHKAMFIALRDGKFDAVVEGTAAPSMSTQALAAPGIGVPSIGPFPITASSASVSFVPQPAALAPTLPPMAPPAVAVIDASGVEARPHADVTLDLAAVERAASEAGSPARTTARGSELPPPPPNLFREKPATTGKYRITPPPPPEHAAPQAPPGAPRRPSPAPAPPGRARGPSAERRYAPTRPASIFGQAKPQGKSIFGEDLNSDKSLDDVILSYLAEDLETEKKKKT